MAEILFYNPERMPEAEIKATFVARQGLVDELIALIRGQPDGAGVQHVVIVAPRGMGKTTVLLMVKFGLADRGLTEHWQAVKFPEESYGIYDLADFWLEVLNLLAADTGDEALAQRLEALKEKYPDSDQLQQAALALLKDWRRTHGKRLVLLVENFDQILAQIGNERDNARLRDVLMNDGTVMLIGGATTFFKEARAYDQPLYNFFKLYDLNDLSFPQMQELLRRRADLEGVENFEEKLRTNAGRLRALEYFTGGNPRLVLMLYRVVTRSDMAEIRRALEKLLDEVTPYYKAKVESLPAQQRKILDTIARASGVTGEGVTPGEIAKAVRLSPNQVSSQLKRLAEEGYVRAANLRRRSSYYVLSEPLYAIWHQMRFGRVARRRMEWLVTFLRVWYEAGEIEAESRRLAGQFLEYVRAKNPRQARDVLEHRSYLVQGIDNAEARAREMDGVLCGYLELGDAEAIRKERLLDGVELARLSEETLKQLRDAGCIDEERYRGALAGKPSEGTEQDTEYLKAMVAATEAYFGGNIEDALRHLDRALEIKPDQDDAWYNRGIALGKLGRHEEALASFDRALELKPDDDGAWYNRGYALAELGRYEEALVSYNRALELKPDKDKAWNNRGVTLAELGRYEEALASYDRALAIKPDDDTVWNNRGITLGKLGRHEEALASFDRALAIKPDDDTAWNNHGITLAELSRLEEALASYDRALAIKPDDDTAWYSRSVALLGMFMTLAERQEWDLARQSWTEALRSGSKSKFEGWRIVALESALTVAGMGHLDFVKQLIEQSDLGESLFPLARAIDYLLTGDEELIEKLSPEVRGIVEEVVARLRESAKGVQNSSLAE